MWTPSTPATAFCLKTPSLPAPARKTASSSWARPPMCWPRWATSWRPRKWPSAAVCPSSPAALNLSRTARKRWKKRGNTASPSCSRQPPAAAAAACAAATARRRSSPPSTWSRARPPKPSATPTSSLKNSWSGPSTSRCRSWPTSTAMWSTFTSATAPCSAASRRWWSLPPPSPWMKRCARLSAPTR